MKTEVIRSRVEFYQIPSEIIFADSDGHMNSGEKEMIQFLYRGHSYALLWNAYPPRGSEVRPKLDPKKRYELIVLPDINRPGELLDVIEVRWNGKVVWKRRSP